MSAVSGATGTVLFNLEGTELENLFGRAVCGVGDSDADGIGDFVVGVPHDNSSALNAGRILHYSGGSTDNCGLDFVGSVSQGSTFTLRHLAQPLAASLMLGDVSPGPTNISPFGAFSLGFSPALTVVNDSLGIFGVPFGVPLDSQGLALLGPITVPPQAVGITIHLQGFGITSDAPNGWFQRSNPLPITFTP